MTNWNVRTRIATAFGVTIGVLLVVSGVAYISLGRMHEQAVSVSEDALPGLAVSMELNTLVQTHRALAHERTVVASVEQQTEDERLIAVNNDRTEEQIRAYEPTIRENYDRVAYERMRAAFNAYRELKRAGKSQQAEITAAYEKFAAEVRLLVDDNRRTGLTAAASVKKVARSTQLAILIAVVMAMLVAVTAGIVLYRSITVPLSGMLGVAEAMRQGNFSRRVSFKRQDELGVLAGSMNRVAEEIGALIEDIQKTGIQVSTSATEIAATSREQQATANEVVATTAEIGATSRQISATAKELSKTMGDIAHVSEGAAAAAANGQGGLHRMQETMQQIIDASAVVTDKLADVNEKAANISLVVTTITKVADQTNLLSLNAAIEAEKAGEYGRGFSVVASEIRRLADQTAVAVQDIEKTVAKMQAAVSAGVMGMEKFGDQVRTGVNVVRQVGADLASVIDQVQTLTPAFESANEGMQGQSVAAEQISDALTQLNEAVQQTAESLRQSNSAIEQLNNVTRGLRQSVSRFAVES
jgi:methyl-accepting chemotaxis protein WspA